MVVWRPLIRPGEPSNIKDVAQIKINPTQKSTKIQLGPQAGPHFADFDGRRAVVARIGKSELIAQQRAKRGRHVC